MAKPSKEKRRFFGLFPGRSNTFAPPARTDDSGAMNAALLVGIIASDPGPIDDGRKQDSASHYDHPADDPLNTPSYQNSPSHYDYGGSSHNDSYGSSGSGYDGGGSSGGSDGGGGGGGGD